MPADTLPALAVALARLRADAGLTQRALADLSGVKSSMIAHAERGRKTPSLDALERLADALHCTLDQLAGRQP